MTQVHRVRVNVRRRGVVYGFICFDVDPRTGLIRIDPTTGAPLLRMDYVGQTRQKLVARDEQHRDDKPWSDLIVRVVELDRGDWLNEELDAREVAAIKRVRPRYNDAHNRDNPERIEIYRPSDRRWVQIEQRWARDDAAGVARWVPLDQRQQRGSLLDQPMTVRPTAPRIVSARRWYEIRSWPAWQQKLGLWSAAWGLLVVATRGVFYQHHVPVTWKAALIVGSLLWVALVAWSLADAPLTPRQWRKARRRLPKWLR